MLATANLLSFVGIFLASGAHFLLAQVAQLTPNQIFFFGGVLTLTGAVYALFLLPDALLRFVLWVLTRTVYRIRVEEVLPSPTLGCCVEPIMRGTLGP